MAAQTEFSNFAFKNAIPEFREQYSQNPNFVLTRIVYGLQECEIYLPRNRNSEYYFRIMYIIEEPNPLVREVQFYNEHLFRGRIIPAHKSSHRYPSQADVNTWIEIMNSYLYHRQMRHNDEIDIINIIEIEAPDFDFDDDYDVDVMQDLFTLEYLDRHGGLETQIDDDQYEYDESLISNEILLEDD